MNRRKSVLVVEDEMNIIKAYKYAFEEYDFESIFYRGPSTEVPTKEFDALIIDNLNGECWNVLSKINSRVKIVCSEDIGDKERAVKEGAFFVRKGASASNDLLTILGDELK